jgi:predicted nucleic acid-binding protein
VSGFLLDTNVVSMLSPARAEATPGFLAWLERCDREGRLFLSVVTLHEIEKGVALLERKGAAAKAAGLKLWLAGLVAAYEDRILPVDATAAALAGRLEAKALCAGHPPGMADALVAGVAQRHDLIVVTRNLMDFLPFGVEVASPDALC